MRLVVPRSTVLASVGLLIVGGVVVLTLQLTRNPSRVVETGTQGNITLTASPDPVRAGDVVEIGWTIRGPIRLVTGCENPNPKMWAISPSGTRIQLTHSALCESGSEADVADGQSFTRSILWNTSGLEPGLYSIHGNLTGLPTLFFSSENLPVITVQLMR
jgi:hypothetical protein